MAFCPGHSNCEAPISVITNILTKDPSKFEEISNEFKLLEFDTVKDLANSSFGKIGKINSLGEDPLAKLYMALETYAEFCANQLESAKLKYKQKNFVKAQEICKEMLSHKPHDLEFLVLLAASYYDCEQYDTCMTYLKEACYKNPNCVDLLNNLGMCYYSKSQFVEAFECFKDALCKNMSCSDAWINSAKILNLANKTQEAINAYKMALFFNPNLHNIRIEFAQLLTNLNRTKEAEEQYKIVTKKVPDYVDAWNDLGCLYMNTDKIQDAIICYEKSIELNDSLPKTLYYLGIAYLKIEQYQNAIYNFQKALILCPNDIIILKYLAQVYSHQKNWPLAIDTYLKVLKFHPDDLNSNLNLGLIYDKFQKKYQEAIKYFKIILNLNPLNEEFHRHLVGLYKKLGNNKCAYESAISLGDMFSDQNDFEQARSAYVCALKFDQLNGIGHWKLGNAMYRLGYIDSAFARYKICLELKPNFANAYSECGLICEEKNLLEKALDYYEAAHALDPNNLNVLLNLANLKEKQGKLEDVIQLNYKILEHENSDNYLIYLDIARFQKKTGNKLDALKTCGIAMKYVLTNSELMEVSHLLGSLLLDMKKKKDALLFFMRILELNPQCAISHTNIGSIYKDCDNFIEAIHSYNNALNLIPNFPDAYCNLVQCYQHICDWSEYENRILKLKEIVAKQISNDQVPSILPHHSLLYNFSPEMLKNIALKYAKQCIDKANCVRKESLDYVNQTFLSNGRIRVGYVSSDFGDHPITQLMQSIPKFHDRNKVEVFCYSLSPNDGSLSWSKISTESDHFKDISELEVFDAANLINSDGIHILVNMNGYTKGARNEIFALRPAPIQVLWLGYPSTSGASFIDYLITDKVCSPPELGHFYTEKLAYLNQSVFIGDHKQMYKDLSSRVYQNKPTEENTSLTNGNIHDEDTHSNEFVPKNNTNLMYCFQSLSDGNLKCFTRQMYNLPEDVIVYCNFSQLFKIDPSTFRMWAEILHHVPNSVLWLLQFPISGEQNLKKYAETLNIDPSRIIFSRVEKKEEHMLRIPLADIFLDTPLCNAHTTCLDVLWAGIPVITLPGKTLASRVAASQLTTLGCTDTIAENEEDYVKKAIQLGSDKTSLESIKSKIWSLKTESKLFDCKSYTEELENIYQHMWTNFLSKNDLNMQL